MKMGTKQMLLQNCFVYGFAALLSEKVPTAIRPTSQSSSSPVADACRPTLERVHAYIAWTEELRFLS